MASRRPGWLTPPDGHRRISVVRLVLVLAALGGLGTLGTRWALAMVDQGGNDGLETWFAPYVDVTLTPTLHFEDPTEQPAADVVLGFVVADPADPCTPSWGTYYSMDAAARALDLDRRIVRLRERGGDAVVSFGGALNQELAIACEDPVKLAAAYRAVVERYDLSAVDFDIEGAALADRAANARRSEALKALQAEFPDLEVWLTVPVAPLGLTIESVELLDQLLAAGVELAGLNVMAMNYGGSRESMTMRAATELALVSTFQQLDGAYQRLGAPRTEEQLWAMIGATPMIGQNDVAGDVFTPGDAEALRSFARNVRLGRVSFWSANRDMLCGAVVDDDRVSNTCSGVDQEPHEFAGIFATGATARLSGEPVEATDESEDRAEGLAQDDPRSSPYPLWRSPKAYEEGAKVVWQGRVYQAKWWTQGDQPDAPVKHVWETPWRYLGPVLESDREAVRARETVVGGARPQWVAESVYVAGDEVERDGEVFRAKWWTQGDLPQVDPDQPYDHPWEYLGEADPGD
jgi:chitinase